MISRSGPRVVLGSGLLLVLGLLLLEMSGSAQRQAGSDHVNASVFAATVPGGGVLCQPIKSLPDDVASVRVLIGTYGRIVPLLTIRFTTATGASVAEGRLAGAREGFVTIPLSHVTRPSDAASACLHVGGSSTVALGGEKSPSGTEAINSKPHPGDISLVYLRAGRESWWQLLPVLVSRFGRGKAPFFGDWTLLAMALLLLAVWVGTIRLLRRELG